jgi:hypothetical protein
MPSVDREINRNILVFVQPDSFDRGWTDLAGQPIATTESAPRYQGKQTERIDQIHHGGFIDEEGVRKIKEKGADYVIGLKDNQPKLRQ